jgi:hypothetical protein
MLVSSASQRSNQFSMRLWLLSITESLGGRGETRQDTRLMYIHMAQSIQGGVLPVGIEHWCRSSWIFFFGRDYMEIWKFPFKYRLLMGFQ